MKIIKTICSIILTFLLILLITSFIGLTVVKQTLNLESTPDFFFLEDVQALEVTDIDISNISSFSPDLIHEYVDDMLEENGIPKESLDYILEEGDYQKIIKEYQNDYIQYLAGQKEMPKLPIDEIYEMIDKGMEAYNKETNKNIDTSIIKQEINKATLNIEDSLEQVGENRAVKTTFKILANKSLNIIFIISIFVVILFLLIVNGISTGLIYTSIAGILSGLISILISQLLNVFTLESLKSMLGSLYSNASASFLAYGFIAIMISIILLVIPIMIKIKNKGSNIND